MNYSDSRLLQIRPRPLADELLSSWIVRLAHAQGMKVETLCVQLLGRGHSTWNRDVDTHPPQRLVAALSLATCQPEAHVRDLTLVGLKEELGASNIQASFAPWIMPLGIYHRSRRRRGLMFCPLCLRDSPAYFRRSWRLAFITECETHGCSLIDACPDCGAALAPHRTDLQRSGFIPQVDVLRMCWHCGWDLARSPRTASDGVLLEFTRSALTCVRQGYIARGSNPSLYASVYFQGVRLVAAALARKRRAFEFTDVESRRETLALVAQAVGGDDVQLRSVVVRAGINYSQVVVSGHDHPYWLVSELAPLERWQAAPRNYGESLAAALVLEREQGRVRTARLRSRWRVEVTQRELPMPLRDLVSWDAFDHLLAWTDHCAARTAFDPKLRLRHLQDKVLFTLLRFPHWSAAALSRLRAQEVEALVPAAPELDTWSSPRDEQQALAWLVWHHVYLRPLLASESPYEFLSPYSGRRLGANAIKARFSIAVSSSYLHASIPRLTSFRQPMCITRDN